MPDQIILFRVEKRGNQVRIRSKKLVNWAKLINFLRIPCMHVCQVFSATILFVLLKEQFVVKGQKYFCLVGGVV